MNIACFMNLLAAARAARRPLALVAALAVAGCGGGGGDSKGDDDDGGSGATVTITGKITFDRVPFKTGNEGLDLAAPVVSPARSVVVEAVGASDAILASASTDTAGDYSLAVPVNTQVKIRAKAQMLKTGAAPTWNFRVLNNTNSDALYAVDGTTFDSGTASSVHSLHAPSGWSGSSYSATHPAAPFAILDTVYQAQAMTVSAAPSTVFPALNLFWSPTNKGTLDDFCPDDGDILTSIYVTFASSGRTTDDCGRAGVEGIYILGDFANGNGDTDEFDQHVIAHEFGHYLEDKFSRSDSVGGDHSLGQRLDLRVAFGEGWGDAFSGMALNDPVYRDSQSGQASEAGFNMETDGSDTNEGWYSEASVMQILWDMFDAGSESGDTVNLGFAPIFAAFSGAQKTTNALTSIYSFAAALIAENSSSASGIRALLIREDIAGDTAYGTGETNFASKTILDPVYATLTLGGAAVQVCGITDFGTYNKLGNRRFLRLDLATSRAVQITAQAVASGSPAPDPDIALWKSGQIGQSQEEGTTEFYTTPVLAAGTYIVEVAEYSHIAQEYSSIRRGQTCINVSVAGT